MIDARQELGLKRRTGWWVRLATATVLTAFDASAAAQEEGQKTFTSPADASKALYDAAKAGDEAAIEAVLGASSKSIISSGDSVAD